MRLFVFAVFLGTFVAAVHATAQAAKPYELCPADAELVPIVDPNAPSAAGTADYALTLEGATQRTVSGTVRAFAGNQWYSIAFSKIPLTAFDEKFTGPVGTFDRTDYVSRDEIVHFPAPVTVEYTYVDSAEAPGETVVGWGAKGRVNCTSAGLFSKWGIHSQSAVGDLTFLNPRAVPQLLGFAFGLKAVPIPAPGPTNCDIPFAWAQVTSAQHPTFPQGAYQRQGASIVDVGIMADGSVDDGWLWASTGEPLFDTSGESAAGASSYSPARAFCKNVPGMFRYLAEFGKT